MKKFIYIAMIGVVISSCGGGGGDTPPDPIVNKAPAAPTLAEPTNNSFCIDNSVPFKWNVAVDPDGDVVSYEIEVSKNSQFSPIVNTVPSTAVTKSIALEKGTQYYWRVKAKDSKNASSEYSSVYQFYTEGVGIRNYLPFAPSIVAPALNSPVATAAVSLSWTASDVDTADTLTYDVYFDTVNPPAVKVATGVSTKTLTQNTNPSTKYYWYVVVKDNHGGQTIGQVWNFTRD